MGKYQSLVLFVFFMTQMASASESLTEYSIEPGCISHLEVHKDFDCKSSVIAFESFLKNYLDNPKKVKSDIYISLKKIVDSKSYQYGPIFISAFLEEKEFLGELKRIEILEKKLMHSYARMAEEKIDQGKCPFYLDSNYHEICHFEDPIFEKLKRLKGIQ